MGDEGFAARLTLVLKALSISRGRLAADVAVDKSLVSRWCSGSVQPSAHNLARLTQVIAARVPGFTMVDWDHDLAALADRFGVAVPGPAAETTEWFPPQLIAEAVTTVEQRGHHYEGLWKTTRLASEMPGSFIHDHVLLRRGANGLLAYRAGVFDVRFAGWAMPLQNQLFAMAYGTVSGTLVFSIFNGVARQRAEVLDGLLMTCMRDAGGTPVAGRILMRRVGDLCGDAAEDDARLEALLAENPLATPDSMPDDIRDHLWSDCGPTAFAAGGEHMMMMNFARSIARGPVFETATR
jgi:transcriptional regulator with XRE-family HTH domain